MQFFHKLDYQKIDIPHNKSIKYKIKKQIKHFVFSSSKRINHDTLTSLF